MASIQLREIELQSPNPAPFNSTFQFQLTVDVLDILDEDMEMKCVWVRPSDGFVDDLILEELIIGPLSSGTTIFVAHVSAPPWQLISEGEILGDTLLMLSLHYHNAEFVSIGYWVHVTYINHDDNIIIPETFSIDRICRVLRDPPIVRTAFINWENHLDEHEEHENFM